MWYEYLKEWISLFLLLKRKLVKESKTQSTSWEYFDACVSGALLQWCWRFYCLEWHRPRMVCSVDPTQVSTEKHKCSSIYKDAILYNCVYFEVIIYIASAWLLLNAKQINVRSNTTCCYHFRKEVGRKRQKDCFKNNLRCLEWDYSTCSDVYQCVHLERKNYQFDINEWLEWQLIRSYMYYQLGRDQWINVKWKFIFIYSN